MLSRRNMIMGLAASALVPGFACGETLAVRRNAALATALHRSDCLAARAARLKMLFGTAADITLDPSSAQFDSAYAEVVARECSLLCPDPWLKANITRASPDRFDFSIADRLVTFAFNHGMAARGHTLIWDQAVPSWVTATITTDKAARAELLREVTEPCRHFRRRMDSWDVVNEVIAPEDGRPDGLRNSFWCQKIGSEYIPLAFRAAREADPNALLVLNEADIEADSPYHERRRKALLTLLQTLRRENVPLDALGIESHLWARPFNPRVFGRFLDSVHELGLKILVSELDFNDFNLPSDKSLRDSTAAQAISAYLNVVLLHPGLVTISAWGLTDKYSWLREQPPRNDGLPRRPTVLDSNLVRKKAYYAVRNALETSIPIVKEGPRGMAKPSK